MSKNTKNGRVRMVGKSGRVWVTRSVVYGRKVPGYHLIDPLAVPLLQRRTFLWRVADKFGLTMSEAEIRVMED